MKKKEVKEVKEVKEKLVVETPSEEISKLSVSFQREDLDKVVEKINEIIEKWQ